MINDIYVTDKTSIHVFEGHKFVDIYTKETGIPKIHIEEDWVEPKENGADTDGDILDKDWARDRNRQIEKEVQGLRSVLSDTYVSVDENKEIRSIISELLKERDDITYKYGLAGGEFNRLYEEKNDISTKDYSYKPNSNEARFKQITKEMAELYSRKNADYGGSFDQSLDEDGLLVAKIRLKDKLNRFSQLIDNDILVASESIEDTLIDLANYSIMTLMWINDEKD